MIAPLSGADSHVLPGGLAWHGRLMVVAWSIAVPIGILSARFFKIMPGQRWPVVLDHKAWWHTHRTLQVGGLVCASVGLGMALPFTGSAARFAAAHRWLGFAVLAIGVVQTVGGFARGTKGGPADPALRGDHFAMTARRVVFERVHKALGWLVVPLAIAATALGLVVADAPRWMAAIIGGWWCALIAAGVALQRRGRCADTYQAIWGADPALPGNRRRPIGWGVRRRDPADPSP